MSGDRASSDLGAERDIDLRRWRDAIRNRIWIVVACAVGGIVLGGLYSLSGGSEYNATALIAPGQVFGPSGSPVLTYLTSLSALNTLATSTPALDAAAKQAKMTTGELRGHVTTSAVNLGTGTSNTARTAALVGITVQVNKPKRAEDAANAIATYLATQTTPKYVQQSLETFKQRLANFGKRIVTLNAKIKALNQVLDGNPQSLAPLDRLVLSTQLDSAEAALGSTLDAQESQRQNQILYQDISRTQVIQQAKAARTTARSRRNSIVVGLVLGLLVGIIAAIVVDTRSRRRQPQPA
jgi:uncharacterized protein involved in exopolysaccharide biosynthesis